MPINKEKLELRAKAAQSRPDFKDLKAGDTKD